MCQVSCVMTLGISCGGMQTSSAASSPSSFVACHVSRVRALTLQPSSAA